ncbi:AVL9 family protein [Megaselia abdita]
MEKPLVLNILVIGFHHKKGSIVEFSYPPLIQGSEGKNECPSGWKYLPTLALPDGAHNFSEDSVFFNLPSLTEPTETVYGVSCYRQIPVEKLKIKTADVTRSTVQKSVCVLSRSPIFGYLEVKLSLIADAFFEQGDFDSTDILVKAYQQLNACLVDESRPLRHFYVGLSLREIMLKWRHKVLILFKLLLLQKRVVCFSSPVRPMCALILGITSLMPRLLEKGFQEVACVRTSRPLSPMPDFTVSCGDIDSQSPLKEKRRISPASESPSSEVDCVKRDYDLERRGSDGLEVGKKIFDRSNSLTREASSETLSSCLYPFTSVNPDVYRSPVLIFTSGHLCLPYISLPYMDLLSDTSVLSYIIGTSNVLFQQKKNLADILVDIENATLEATDPELKKQLDLTTEDLRFVNFILRHVQNPKEDAEGSEGWIREQFQGYILALLKTAVISFSSSNDLTKEADSHFNTNFVCYFKKTQCFQEWYDARPDDEFFDSLPNGHPFSGTITLADMKLRISTSMHNTESGKKINQAVNNTSKAVGGAISSAKGALSSWWNSMTTQNKDSEERQSDESSTPPEEYHDNGIEDSLSSDEGEMIDEKQEPQVSVRNDGIVEIAREAELLDKTKSEQEKDSDDIFIV